MTRLALIASAILLSPAAMAQRPPAEHDHSEHAPAPAAAPRTLPADAHAGHVAMPPAEDKKPRDHGSMDHSAMDHAKMDHKGMDHAGMQDDAGGHQMSGAFGEYPMTRDGSGTSWIPDEATHGGMHANAGDWMLMGHANLDLVYTDQQGPRGDTKVFAAGMFMGTARRDFGGNTLQFRAMVSPDSLMGKRGYPLLLAAGETADGVDTLVDRQHPHDLFMELSASYSMKVSDNDSVLIYGGLPGEPAFGPPAFMHRPAAAGSPEAPITHHWMDSTHITFGVVTAGWVHDNWKIEASRFRGREPDEKRYDIETGELDSTSVRATWNPTKNWSLQGSWADVTSPEQLEPNVNMTKYAISALYTRKLANEGELSLTGAYARKDSSEGGALDGWLAEAAWKPNADWTVFSRAEAIETDELGAVHHGPVEDVSRIGVGMVRDFRVSEKTTLGLGVLVNRNMVSGALSPSYAGDPWGGMAFVRLKVG
jgi:hypothetical protein